MGILVAAGNITKDAVFNNNRLNFSVADNVGWGDKKQTLFYNCTLWGKRGESMVKFMKKGTNVMVDGEFSTYNDSEGKTRLALTVNNVKFVGKTKGYDKEKNGNKIITENEEIPFDDEIPF
jgi:single-strand DNA-binding protein